MKKKAKKKLAFNKAIQQLKDLLNQKGATHKKVSRAIDKIHDVNDQPDEIHN